MIQKTERARNPETTLHMTDKRLRARVLSQLEHQQDMHTRHNDVDPQGSILFVVVHHYEHQERTTKRERERERERERKTHSGMDILGHCRILAPKRW